MLLFRWPAILFVTVLAATAPGCGSQPLGERCEGSTVCGDHGTCDDTSGVIVCHCDEGYTGDQCDACAAGYQDYGDGECRPDDPCAGTTVCADLHRECVNDEGTQVCGPCLDGFGDYGDGECRPSDPCAGTTVCADLHRECLNDQGVAVCGPCLDGYTDYGDGDCLPSDPCATDTLCAAEFRLCVNDQGTAVCGDCLPGYADDAGVCVEVCLPTHHVGVLASFDLLFLLDRSASMTDQAKWTTMVTGVDTFVSSADASGVGVGVGYFPVAPSGTIPTACSTDPDCGLYGPCMPSFNQCLGSFSLDTSCDPADYDGAEVPITQLPAGLITIQTSLTNQNPSGGATPTQPSLEGTLSHAVSWAQSHPTHTTQVVLITDGEPTGCMYNSIGNAAAAAQAAATGSPAVLTFVIGLGAALGSLDPIAQGGGTGQVYLVDMAVSPAQQLQDALADIRAHGHCRYQIPAAVTSTGDYHLVNLALVDPANPPGAIDVAAVSDATGCDPVAGGWYYDSAVNPTELLLCAASCATLTQGALTVDVLVGCDTIAP